MTPSTPAAKIPRWWSYIKGAWLIKIGKTEVFNIKEAQCTIQHLVLAGVSSIPLLFLHPEICQDVSQNGLSIVSSTPFAQHIHDQINHRWDFSTVANYLRRTPPPFDIVESGDLLNYVT
jgi:hypothetical protein